ncbi:MAG: hypothetical protein BWY30_01103 [Tenericutes bacterium ADurb.Bin239]|nr:MAG: hypothetical protein BWY30_01103 [Tenericutes bacterium ADurb.Bin239]
MKRIIRSLKTVNYRLWLALLILLMLPTIYQTVRIFFLGNMPSDWGINIASQLQWLGLFYEVIQEAMILPLFFLMGKSLGSRDELSNKVKTGLLVSGLIYGILSLLIIIFAAPLVKFMAQDVTLLEATVTYIRLETIASLFATLVKFVLIVFMTIKKDKVMYILLGVQMLLSIIFDTFFISNLSFSLNIGVNGIAFTNIIVNLVMLIVGLVILHKLDIHVFCWKKLNFSWMKEWFSVGKWSGLESFLRNLAFMVMIVRMMNIVSEQGNYWIANNFIWGWLLIPGLALADLVKQETAASVDNIRTKTFGYLTLTTIFTIVWLLSIPLWKPFLRYVMNVQDYETVFCIVLIQTGFYLTFFYNNCIFDATFYGRGKTGYMLIQSLCIDVFYYGVMFILFLTGVFIPTLVSVSLMFGIGMVLDFIPTMILYVVLLKRENIKIDFKLETATTNIMEEVSV